MNQSVPAIGSITILFHVIVLGSFKLVAILKKVRGDFRAAMVRRNNP